MIIQGDCLEILPTLAADSVDAIVTDPPYMIGAISVGNSSAKCGTWADMENSAHWFSAWMRECKRVLKPNGYMLIFCGWRTIPTLVRASSLIGLSATNCAVWDKQWIGPAAPNQLRPLHEMILWFAMENAHIKDRSVGDIFRCKWMAGNMKESEHPAEKPVALIKELLEVIAVKGDHILDPFCGSGSVGCAADVLEMNFTGIEREERWCAVAEQRITNERSKGVQESLL